MFQCAFQQNDMLLNIWDSWHISINIRLTFLVRQYILKTSSSVMRQKKAKMYWPRRMFTPWPVMQQRAVKMQTNPAGYLQQQCSKLSRRPALKSMVWRELHHFETHTKGPVSPFSWVQSQVPLITPSTSSMYAFQSISVSAVHNNINNNDDLDACSIVMLSDDYRFWKRQLTQNKQSG